MIEDKKEDQVLEENSQKEEDNNSQKDEEVSTIIEEKDLSKEREAIISEENAVTVSKGQLVLNFLKRYWYWFVVLSLLLAGILIWCWQLGLIGTKKTDTPDEITIHTDMNQDEIIRLNPGQYYYFNVVVSDGSQVKYSSSDTDVFSFDSDSPLGYARGLGDTTVTATAVASNGQVLRTQFLVSITQVDYYWQLSVGDTFDFDDLASCCGGANLESNSLSFVVNGLPDDDAIFADLNDVILDLDESLPNTEKEWEIVGVGNGYVVIYVGTMDAYIARIVAYLYDDGEHQKIINNTNTFETQNKEAVLAVIDTTDITYNLEMVKTEDFNIINTILQNYGGYGFEKYGYLVVVSNNEDILTAAFDGNITINTMPKDSADVIVTLALIMSDQIEYINVKVTLKPLTIYRKYESYQVLTLEEIINENEAYEDRTDRYDVVIPHGYESYVDVSYGAIGLLDQVTMLLPCSYEDNICICGYNANGDIIFKEIIGIE